MHAIEAALSALGCTKLNLQIRAGNEGGGRFLSQAWFPGRGTDKHGQATLNMTTVPVKCVTLDLDDTLWDCPPVIIAAEKAFYDWLGVRFPRIAEHYELDGFGWAPA